MFKKVIAATAVVIVFGVNTAGINMVSVVAAAEADCDFSNAEANGGWGWDPVDKQSCPPPGTDPVGNNNQGPEGPAGPPGPQGPAALTHGANIGVVAISGTDINGTGSDQARIGPGDSFTVSFDYTIIDTACPGCIDQIQVGIVTRDGVGESQDCAYDGQPGASGVTNNGSVNLVAPADTGTYYIAFDRAQHFSCDLANSNGAFWSGTVGVNRFIGAIAVY